AQVATLPLTFYYFHQFPVYFLIANVTVIPFAGFLLATVIFVVAFSWIPVVGAWIVKLLSLEITAITSVTSFVEKLPHATITDFYFDKVMVLLTALLILGYAIALVKRKKWALFSAMAMSIVFVAYVGYVSYQKKDQRKWIVYSTRNHLVMEFVGGNRSYFVSDSAVVSDPKSVEFSTQGYQRQNMTDKRVNVLFQDNYKDDVFFSSGNFGAFGQTRFVFITPENVKTKSKVIPSVDYVIIEGSPRLKDVSELTEKYHFKELIIASNNSQYKSLQWQHQCDSLQIPCHNVVADGAFEKVVSF
ncbi:MAG: ComEC/Rec2 family competence protein, partial [Bacteroidales bacterium]|nr:ComEC/Rec2 family competence protein [Bacteroidales bacterium]